MPDTEPNGTPAASDAAGQRPTDGTVATTTATTPMTTEPQQQPTDGQASGQQPTDGQQQPGNQDIIQNPVAKAAADEAARYRTQLRDAQKAIADYQAKEKALADAQLSELERAQKQVAEWQQKHADTTRAMQERIVGYEIQLQASRLNIIDPDAAVKLLDWSHLEYDEDGVPTNAAQVLADLVKAKPYLVAASQAASASGGMPAGNAPTDANAQLAAQLGATNPPRQNGPITVTANQYMDKAFKADFKNRYGMELDTAVLRGKAQIV